MWETHLFSFSNKSLPNISRQRTLGVEKEYNKLLMPADDSTTTAVSYYQMRLFVHTSQRLLNIHYLLYVCSDVLSRTEVVVVCYRFLYICIYILLYLASSSLSSTCIDVPFALRLLIISVCLPPKHARCNRTMIYSSLLWITFTTAYYGLYKNN